MLKRTLLLITIVTGYISLTAQEKILTLEECLQKAEANHPALEQLELFSSSGDLRIKNLNRNYLPEMNINGDAHYQSNVTQVPTIIPQFAPEPLSKDWYKITLDVSQVIYDGGLTGRSKELENIEKQINLQNVGIEIYKLKDRVTTAYFNIIMLQENRALLDLHQETLRSRLKEVESGVAHGMLLSSNADILRAELLKIDQKILEIEVGIGSAYRVLSILTGEEIETGTRLEMASPEINILSNGQDRLEFGLFNLQQQKTASMKKLASSKLMPKLMAYGQAGYGRPGFDMLKNDFDDFYTIGARLNWNFYNWNKTRNEKAILDLSREIIQSNIKTFDQGISIELERKRAEIIRFEGLLDKDAEIARLRASIAQTYASRLNNGVITATEYITELNAETEALLNLKIHQVQLIKAKFDYLAAAGKL